MRHLRVSAFTLIELIVVVGIIGIIAAIVIVAVNPARQFARSRNTQRTQDVKTIYNALVQYSVTNGGSFPSELTTTWLNICNHTNTASCATNSVNLRPYLVPTYLSDIPRDPVSGTTSDTRYVVYKNSSNRITVIARDAELDTPIAHGDQIQAPTQVSNMTQWLSATTLQGTSNGSAVSTWTDKSGNNRNATQPLTTRQPTYRTNAINGQATVRFDGTDDTMSTTGGIAQTIITVIKHNATPATGLANVFRGGGNWDYAGTTYFAINRFSAWFLNGAWRSGTKTPDTQPHVVSHQLTTAGARTWIDGDIDLNYSATITSTTGTLHTIGSWAGSQRYLNGDIAELVVYNHVLTDDERKSVERYFAAIYNLPYNQ